MDIVKEINEYTKLCVLYAEHKTNLTFEELMKKKEELYEKIKKNNDVEK